MTLACRTFRIYVSKHTLSANLQTIARFCISVYFSTWFEIQKQSQIIHGAKNFSNSFDCTQQFPHSKIRSIALATQEVPHGNAFLHILKMFFWVCWEIMRKKLEN